MRSNWGGLIESGVCATALAMQQVMIALIMELADKNEPHLAQEIMDEHVVVCSSDDSLLSMGARLSRRFDFIQQTTMIPLPERAALEAARLDLRMARLEAGDLQEEELWKETNEEWLLSPHFLAGGVEMRQRWYFTPVYSSLSKWISESDALRQKAGELLRQ